MVQLLAHAVLQCLRTDCSGSKDTSSRHDTERESPPSTCRVSHIFDSYILCTVYTPCAGPTTYGAYTFSKSSKQWWLPKVAFSYVLFTKSMLFFTSPFAFLQRNYPYCWYCTAVITPSCVVGCSCTEFCIDRIRCTFRFARKKIVPTLGLWFKARVRLSKVSF